MILRGLSNVCEVDFVVRAPDGKEVEELTRKDIIKALRTKVPIDQALSRLNHGSHDRGGRPPFGQAAALRAEEGVRAEASRGTAAAVPTAHPAACPARQQARQWSRRASTC